MLEPCRHQCRVRYGRPRVSAGGRSCSRADEDDARLYPPVSWQEARPFSLDVVQVYSDTIQSLVASLATGRHKAAKTLFRHLEPIVEKRLADLHSTDKSLVSKPASQLMDM